MMIRLVIVFLLAATVVGVTDAAPRDWDTYPVPGFRVPIGTHRLHIHCTGQGTPTVILDAGLGGTSLEWSKVQPEVARFTRVCSYDRSGYGWSDAGPAPRTSSTIAMELSRLLAYAGITGPYVLVGHSFGGLAARLFASRFPKQISGLVMVDSAHEDQFDRFDAAEVKTVVPSEKRWFVISNHYQVPQGMPEAVRVIAQGLALAPDTVAALYGELRNMRLSAKQVQAENRLPDVPLVVLAHDSRARARSLRAKKMAEIWMSMQAELAARSRQGQLIVTKTSGHHIHLQEPGLVIDAIRSIVDASKKAASSCTDNQITHSC